MSEIEKKSDNRRIWYKFLIYPESVKEGWFEYIQEHVAVYVISPLHDKDVKEINENGEAVLKKPHYHVLIKFSSKKSLQQVLETFECIGAVIDKTPVTVPPPNDNKSLVSDPGHWVRYWIHADHKNKYQYDIKDIKHTDSFDIMKFFVEEKSNDNAVTIAEMLTYAKKEKIRKYGDFLDKCMEENFDWFKICVTTRAGSVVNEYLKSKYPPAYFSRGLRQ